MVEKKSSLKRNAVIAGGLLGLFVAASILALVYFYQALNQDTDLHLKEVAARGAAQASTIIDDNFKFLTALSDGIVLEEKTTSQEKLDRLKIAASKQELLRLGLAGPDGSVVTTDGTTFNVASEDYFREAMHGNNSISKILTGPNGEMLWTISVPVIRGDTVEGVLFEQIPVDKLNQTMDVNFFGEKGYSYIVDNDGVILMSKDPAEVDQNFYEIAAASEKAGRESANLKQFENQLRQNQDGAARLRLYGQDFYVSFASMKSVNNDRLNILCVVPSDLVFQGANHVMAACVFACVGLVLIFGLIFFIFLNQTRRHTQKLAYIAYYDQLTEIPNYNKFCMDCEQELKENPGMSIAVMDIVHFHLVNDTFGYRFGDKALNAVAGCLKNRLDGLYARISDDVFAIGLKCGREDPALQERLEEIAGDIGRINILGMYLNLKVSFGVACLEGSTNIRTCLDNAKTVSKIEDATESVHFFNKEQREKMEKEYQLQTELEKAFEQGQMEVYYQPLMSFETGEITGAEALIRWNHPVKGLMEPMTFIPLAERTGLINRVGRFVFREVCMHVAEWKKYNHPLLVSVNFSRVELYQSDLVKYMQETMQKYKVDPSQVEIELTESAEIEDQAMLREMVRQFKNLGLRVAIDDFGTGYSTIGCLESIPFDVLKLDRSLVQNLEISERSINTTQSVVTLAKSLGFIVVAEGVETAKEAEILKKMGCDTAQGYFYAHPMKKHAVEMFAFYQPEIGK